MEKSCGMEVSGGGVEYSSGMEVSSMERPAVRPPDRRPPRSPTQLGQLQPHPPPLPWPWIGYILTTVDDTRGLMDGPCDVDASLSCTTMHWSSPIKGKTDLVM